jgi:hypothetical protein
VLPSNYAFKRTAGTLHEFPDVLSARSRLTRRWALGVRVRSSLLRQTSSSRLRTYGSFATRRQCERGLSRQAVSFPGKSQGAQPYSRRSARDHKAGHKHAQLLPCAFLWLGASGDQAPNIRPVAGSKA